MTEDSSQTVPAPHQIDPVCPILSSSVQEAMEQKTKFLLALTQVDNLSKLIEGNQFEHFFVSHLLPIKFEIERQLSLIQNND